MADRPVTAMLPPLTAGIMSLGADALIVVTVLAGMALGTRAGLVRSIVAGIVAIAAVFFPLALAAWLARLLVSLEGPPHLAIGGSFLAMSAVAAAGMQRMLSALIAGDDCRMPQAADLVGGGLLGACTGSIIAGTVLVAWSMLPMPWPRQVAPVGVRLDAGAVVLRAFGRCLAEGRHAREALLEGEPLTWKHGNPAGLLRNGNAPVADEESPETILASETFVDENANGRHDTGERYLDADDNAAFSTRLPFFDANSNRRRDVGLLERYRLGRWDSVVVLSDPNDGHVTTPPPPAAAGVSDDSTAVDNTGGPAVDDVE